MGGGVTRARQPIGVTGYQSSVPYGLEASDGHSRVKKLRCCAPVTEHTSSISPKATCGASVSPNPLGFKVSQI